MSSQASLVYQDAEGERRDLGLNPGGDTTIGRHPQCTLSINQPSVSRRHARLWMEDGRWYVEDLGSSNGTYVNNRRITKQELDEGDNLRCGDFKLNYVVEDHTREVGQLEPPVLKRPAAAPRVVGSLSARGVNPPDPEAQNKRTIGLMTPDDDEHDAGRTTSGREELERAEAAADLAVLKRQLDESQTALKRAEVENRDLKSQCRDLTRKLAAADAANDTSELETALDESRQSVANLERELETVRAELVEASARVSTTEVVASSDLTAEVGELYRDLDELTSELRLKLKLADGLIGDLVPVINAMERLRGENLPKALEDIVRDAVDGQDARGTMDAVASTFTQAERSARLVRRMIRILADTLRGHGWSDSQ